MFALLEASLRPLLDEVSFYPRQSKYQPFTAYSLQLRRHPVITYMWSQFNDHIRRQQNYPTNDYRSPLILLDLICQMLDGNSKLVLGSAL